MADDKAPKFVYQSRLTGVQHALTEQEFKDFAKSVDPDGVKFYNAGPFTPTEVDGPAAQRRTIIAPQAPTETK